MLNITCLCGLVRIKAEQPDFIHECNCTLCRKTGARWGYFDPSSVTVTGETGACVRADKAEPNASLHFCLSCGSTTHFVLTEAAVARHGNTLAGVNMALADPADLAGVELRFPDGAGWSGLGTFTYLRESIVLTGRPGWRTTSD